MPVWNPCLPIDRRLRLELVEQVRPELGSANSLALTVALPNAYFAELGLPNLHVRT